MARFRPARGKSIKLTRQQFVVYPDTFDASEVSPESLKGWIDEGVVTAVDSRDDREAKDNDEELIEEALKPRKGKRIKQPKKWNKDPKALTMRTLEELNVMVGEVDPNVEPFETIEEAIAQLSKNYEPDED